MGGQCRHDPDRRIGEAEIDPQSGGCGVFEGTVQRIRAGLDPVENVLMLWALGCEGHLS